MTYSYSIGTKNPIIRKEVVEDWIKINIEIMFDTYLQTDYCSSELSIHMNRITCQFPDIKFYLYHTSEDKLDIYELYNKKVKLIDTVKYGPMKINGGVCYITSIEAKPYNILSL